MLGFPWAKALVGTAQQMALYFSTDKAALDSLAAEARQLGLPVHLSHCNLSQVQSVHACLQSLLKLQMAIRQALSQYPDVFSHLQVCRVVAGLAVQAGLPSSASLVEELQMELWPFLQHTMSQVSFKCKLLCVV